jgi:hypothetical protein
LWAGWCGSRLWCGDKSKEACNKSGYNVLDHFVDPHEMIDMVYNLNFEGIPQKVA